MALNELDLAAVNSITVPSVHSELLTQHQTRQSDQRLRFCPQCHQQYAPKSFIKIDHFGNVSSAEHCTNYRQYNSHWQKH
jgi:hypothetical protein